MAMRAVIWVALASAVSAVEIGSYASWYEKYTASAAVLGANEVNQQIVGGSEPTELTNDVPEMWRWYRNVGAAEQAKAKAVMDEAAPAAASNAIIVANFKTEYDKELKRTAALPLTAAIAEKGIPTMYDVLGETKPTTAQSIPLWTTYRSFNADLRDQVKKDIVRAPFIKLFTESVANGKKDAGMKTFATATAFVAGTQGSAVPKDDLNGKTANSVFNAFKAEDRAELNALLVPLLTAFQAKV